MKWMECLLESWKNVVKFVEYTNEECRLALNFDIEDNDVKTK